MTKDQIQEYTLKTSQANHSGLMVILFDVERIHTGDALSSYKAGNIDGYLRYIELAKRAHNEIMSGVNPADKAGAGMLKVLRFIYARLVKSAVTRKPDDLERCMAMMDKFKACFEELQKIDDPEPVMKNTHQVYAGLTYGRGTLNESVDVQNYGSRGYKA